MNTDKIFDNLNSYEPKSMKNFYPIAWKSAKDDMVIDTDGKKYIDFTSTIFVMNSGHANKRVKKYLKKQIDSDLLHTYTFAHESRAKLLEKLVNISPIKDSKAFLLSSGTEATESVVRLMKFHGTKINKDKKIIISFKGAMHGRTMAAELMKGIGEHPDFKVLNYPTNQSNFIYDLKNSNSNIDNVCGIMIETYQGWSAKFMPISYIKEIYDVCKAHNILLCFDEIQSGFGRTGKMFGFEHYNVIPDLFCIGKAIGGGLPLSGVIGRSDILDIPEAGEMSSTHSANPLSCSAGLAVLDEFEKENILENIKEKEKIIYDKLTDIIIGFESTNWIKEINHTGMVVGIVFCNKEIATKICKMALDRGLLLVHTGRESIKIGPPLTISNKNLKRGFEIIKDILNDIRN